jgi:hypothetical protein
MLTKPRLWAMRTERSSYCSAVVTLGYDDCLGSDSVTVAGSRRLSDASVDPPLPDAVPVILGDGPGSLPRWVGTASYALASLRFPLGEDAAAVLDHERQRPFKQR